MIHLVNYLNVVDEEGEKKKFRMKGPSYFLDIDIYV